MKSPAPEPLRVADVVGFLRSLAPLELCEPWDNVGLLWGDDSRPVTHVMSCLTLTTDVAGEAFDRGAQLIVSHHPILFHPVQRLTSQTAEGRMLLSLAQRGVAVVSLHTAYDSARDGVNQQLAESLGLQNVAALRPKPLAGSPQSNTSVDANGAGRFGVLPESTTLAEFIPRVKARLSIATIDFVGRTEVRIDRVAVACGSAAEFLEDAVGHECQLLVTGEARFHDCLRARELGVAMILLGHFASERPAMAQLADQIKRRFETLTVWASDVETDPVQRS